MISNLAAYCIQVAVVITAGAALPWVFRLRAARARLVYFQILLLACVALPLVQPWLPRQAFAGGMSSAAAGTDGVFAASATERPWPVAEIAAGALAAGALARFLWLCTGLVRLRRYRRCAQPLIPLTDEITRACDRLGIHPDVYVSEDMTSPVTFGLRSPAILLPAGFLDLQPEARQAIACHELLHIRRKDWLFTIAEEVVRCVLWFHPAVWWLLGRIQLTREQVVDQAAIEHTKEPDHYLDALIAIASTRLQADLAPAPLFLKKRHLRERVASIVKGVHMSKRSLLVSSFAVFSGLPLVVGIAAWQFPLKAAPHRDDAGVEVKQGPWKTLHRSGIAYPLEAREKRISGDVVVSVDVNAKGGVTDARVVSGPVELRKAVLEPVLGWHFEMDATPATFDIAVRFDAAQAASGMDAQPIRVAGSTQQANLVHKVMPVYPADAEKAGLQGLVRLEATIDAEGRVKNIEVVSGNALLVPAAVDGVKQWVYQPTLLNGKPVSVITQVDVNFTLAEPPGMSRE